MRRLCWSIVILSGIVGSLPAEEPIPARDTARGLEKQIRKVIDDAEPSMVSIVVSQSTSYPPLTPTERNIPGRLGRFVPEMRIDPLTKRPSAVDPRLDLSDPQNVPDYLFGSGIVLDLEGTILTNYHLIEGATKIYVRGSTGKGSYADIRAADSRSDLAVLKLIDPLPGLKAARFADVRVQDGGANQPANVARGMNVIALGHPAAAGVGDGIPSASWGILSNIRRRAAGPPREEHRNRALYHYSLLLQTDARVTLGCSGGALLNLDGEVIGLTTPMPAIAGSESASGFAIPFDQNYRRIIEVLKTGREVEYGFLGVTIDRPSTERLDNGLRLTHVTPGTPAALAGLTGWDVTSRQGDTILAIDDHPLREQDDLFLYIGAALAGSRVKLTVGRGASKRNVDVTLAKYHHPLPGIVSIKPPSTFGLRVEYSSVMLLQQDRRTTEQGLPVGVLVREVEPGSAADKRFKPLGEPATRWMITHVNGKSVATPTDFLREAAGKTSLKLRLIDPNPNTVDRDREIDLP